jgi:hypothetical protein
MKGSAIVFDAITVQRSDTFQLDVWYANHYRAAMLQSGVYLGVRCYASPSRGAYLGIFEAATVPPASATAQKAAQHDSILNVERYVAEQIFEQRAPHAKPDILEAAIAYPVIFRVPSEREAEFDAWYKEEHLDILLACPYWPLCRRFKVVNPGADSATHIALHYLTDLRALESDQRTQARNTPWRKRLAQEPWFRGDYRVYHRYGPVITASPKWPAAF